MQVGQPQTQAQLYAAFQDSDPPGTITPQTMRNFVASVPIISNPPGFDLVATIGGLPVAYQYNYYSVVPNGGNVTLQLAASLLGVEIVVWNQGANALAVDAFPGDAIGNAGAFGNSLAVAPNGRLRLVAMSPGFWIVSG